MNVDATTLYDLSIFNHDEELSVLHRFDFTRTLGGRAWLKFYMDDPLPSIKAINERQQLLQHVQTALADWPKEINNGTLMVLGKYFETSVETIPYTPQYFNSFVYKLLNGADYSLVEYTVTHFSAFVRGLRVLHDKLKSDHCPDELQQILERIQSLVSRPVLQRIIKNSGPIEYSRVQVLEIGKYLKHDFKAQCNELIELYCRLDAFASMATACSKFNFSFPVFHDIEKPMLSAKALYHPLIHTPVSYDIDLSRQHNFLFLTGANMAGKSTFIKATGLAVYLAHIGMGVPAKEMELSYFDGLLSNIQVVDNIIKGESYFFNEVQRIHKTIEKISNGKKWLILIDELFKGTNVQDAMKCSTVVIEGLRKMQNTLFVLSTHLYEIGEGLKQYPNIQFRYFETEVKDDQLIFNYTLKEGISNDRLGYLILKREGIVDLLEKL